MPLPSYLSAFCLPTHASAYRRALHHQKIWFSQHHGADEIAKRAARMFLGDDHAERRGVAHQNCATTALSGFPQIRLQFITDTRTAELSTLEAEFYAIANNGDLIGEAAKGRAVLYAIADKIRPALARGALGRTQMAQAAALEIAVAIAHPANLSIGWLAAVDAVNGLNPTRCGLGTPSQWGVSIVAPKGAGRVTVCESTAWDRYYSLGANAAAGAPAKRSAHTDLYGDDTEQTDASVCSAIPHNVTCQAGPVLVADVQTTFAVKTGEWWLTRVLLRRKNQRATVAAKIQMVGFESSEKALHKALAYEDASWRQTACNWLAFLCRFMRGIGMGKVGKREYAHLLKFRPLRDPVPLPPAAGQEENWDASIAACEALRSKKAELLGKDARRAGRRSGTWSGESRYQGRVELKLRYLDNVEREGRNQCVDFAGASVDTQRRPVYEAFATAHIAARFGPSTGRAMQGGSDHEDEIVRTY